MSINHLPNELIILISENLPTSTLNALLRTNKRFASALAPSLHKRALINGDTRSALYRAVANRRLPMVRIILNTGTPVDQLRFRNEPVLQSAMRAKDLTILRLLLEAGADTEATHGLPLAKRRAQRKRTALVRCSALGLVGAARLLLAAGARERELALESATIGAVGGTAWERPEKGATKSGCIETVKLLLDHGVTIDPSPMCTSAKVGDVELLNHLIPRAGKDQLNLAMQEAINFGHIDLVRTLLDSGADPNCKFPRGLFLDTPLIRLFRRLYFGAIMFTDSHVDIVKMLISRGADATFSSHRTAFHWACLAGPRYPCGTNQLYETIRESGCRHIDVFLSMGMDINGPDSYGDTPVHLAVQHLTHSLTHVDYLEYFISQGADVNTVNKEGITPLHSAASSRKDVFIRLIELGADLSISNPSWDTPMVDVAHWGALWPDVLEWYLWRRRAGLGFNGISETALLNASRNAGLRGELEVSKVLLAGVNPG